MASNSCDELQDLLEMSAFKHGETLSNVVEDLDFNNEVFLELPLGCSISKILKWKREANEKKNPQNKMTPDKSYACKCLGPTEAEIKDARKRYWLAKKKKNDFQNECTPELPRKVTQTKISDGESSISWGIIKKSSAKSTSDSKIENYPEWTPPKMKSPEISRNIPVKPNSPEERINNWFESKEKETKKPNSGFTTAREECLRQAAERGIPPPSGITSNSPNSVRRYMGNKLIKPFIPKEPEPENVKKDTEIEDERLQGIDEKLLERLKMDVLVKPTNMKWNDIKGLNFAKETMMEAIVYPLQRPDIFTGLRRPPKGVLMFGPPGTGKTLIAKCVANNAKATFFNISSSSITSKWVGEGEMMVRALFTYARVRQPSVIFIDEVDSLLSHRSDNEHESSRRLKTEFLVFLDGCGSGDSDQVLIIGATNRPWELDEAARRRFTKRLYIPLPEKEARRDIIQHYLGLVDHTLSENDVECLAEATDGFSGADLKVLSETAGYMPMREIIKMNGEGGLLDIKSEDIPPVTLNHWMKALKGTRPSVSSSDLREYLKWNETFGTTDGI